MRHRDCRMPPASSQAISDLCQKIRSTMADPTAPASPTIGSGPTGLSLEPRRANLSASLFFLTPECPGTQVRRTLAIRVSEKSVFLHSSTSADVIESALKAAIAALLSVQINMYRTPRIGWSRRSSDAGDPISAWKMVQ